MEKITSTNSTLQVAQIVSATEAEGPGNRFAIWFQGCPLRCPGCCNPEMLVFRGGVSTLVDDVIQQIEASKLELDIEGISMLGGEPFSHADGAALIAEHARSLNLSVMIYSGFYLDKLKQMAEQDSSIAKLLSNTDLLVDGPYEKENGEDGRRWIGSTNQGLHFLTDFYAKDDPKLTGKDTLEIRFVDGELQFNGFPAKSAKDFWKRTKK